MKFTFETMLKDFTLYYPSFVENAEQIERESDTELIAYQKDGSKVRYDQINNSYKYFPAGYNSDDRSDEVVMRLFGYRLKREMSMRGFNQADLAEQTGVSQATISNYILGKQSPTLISINRIAKALGCSMNDLLRD